MLVCNVSQLARRAAIATEIAEAAAAVDASAIGNIVFATLVDDPASVRDTLDAYLGEIMLEAASASDAFDAGLNYAAAIDEATIAADVSDAAVPVSATISEAVTAADMPDATVISAPVGRSAMLPGAFVNPSTSREAHVAGTMVNL